MNILETVIQNEKLLQMKNTKLFNTYIVSMWTQQCKCVTYWIAHWDPIGTEKMLFAEHYDRSVPNTFNVLLCKKQHRLVIIPCPMDAYSKGSILTQQRRAQGLSQTPGQIVHEQSDFFTGFAHDQMSRVTLEKQWKHWEF